MTKLLIFAGSILGGYGAWWLFADYGLFTGYAASGVGSLIGVYAGWKAARMIER